MRSHIACFDVFGQPGIWQNPYCLYGTKRIILASFDDTEWVHEFLHILFRRKRTYIQSMAGAKLDVVELGGGSTV